jgi:hypothetical protein
MISSSLQFALLFHKINSLELTLKMEEILNHKIELLVSIISEKMILSIQTEMNKKTKTILIILYRKNIHNNHLIALKT